MTDAPRAVGSGTLLALALVIGVSIYLGTRAQRAVARGKFLQGYFLGNRGLGAWALALTATVQSGGTFMGYPSLVYSYGWIVALWIASYMVVPITGFGLMGKRLAQLSRRTEAITMPDLFRARFDSPRVGLVTSLLLLLFLTFMMVAQFKAGALVMKLAWPGSTALSLAEDTSSPLDGGYYLGLIVFSVTVVGYTMIGGFLASVWTDLFQSVLMFFGVLILLALVLPAVGGIEAGNRAAVAHTGPSYLAGPGYSPDSRAFLTQGLAFSYFFVWIMGGIGSPAGVVRLMACKSVPTVRRSMLLLAVYNSCIYLPLVVICVCGRALVPALPAGKSDEIIPRLAMLTTADLPGGSLLAGLILAAPFGAVMSTVSTFLVVIASGLVRDVYQRWFHPEATWVELRRLTHLVMIGVGLIAVLANLRPVQFLQALVVFCSSGQAAAFAVPALMVCYWRRATAPGTIAAMLGGAGTILALYIVGWILTAGGYDPRIGPETKFRPYYLAGMEPVVWGVLMSLVAGVTVSLATRPPSEAVLDRMFGSAEPAAERAPA